jgi:hypothetical protein
MVNALARLCTCYAQPKVIGKKKLHEPCRCGSDLVEDFSARARHNIS